ncbi:MAG TPA: PEP-CTERM sorting domain-containing protein [Verrucomicrobiae bacterium]|nr:PEP-CTERM sorting domain-containing protein [Verrucomicrobiae bacterium]
MKVLSALGNKAKITGWATAVALGLGAIPALGQTSVTYNFSDGTADGWAASGFGSTPPASVVNIAGNNYINIPLGGFQVANVGHGADGSAFYSAMQAAAANPAGYNISYEWNVNTASFSGATFLQIGTFVNTGSGYYAQDFGAVKEVELNGAQLASGQVFSGQVTLNMAAVGFAMPPADTFFRLGFIENGDGTGVSVSFTDISITPVPEPTSLALLSLGLLAGMPFLRRRNA